MGRNVAETCADLEQPVDVVVNYDGFPFDEVLETYWASMVANLTERYYGNVTRYSGSAFVRAKLGEVFPYARTHIFETADQARSFLTDRN